MHDKLEISYFRFENNFIFNLPLGFMSNAEGPLAVTPLLFEIKTKIIYL